MKRPRLLMLSLTLLVLGCTTATEKRYFQLYIPPPETIPDRVIVSGAVRVNPVNVDRIYEGYRLVYRLSPYELDFYNYVYWVKKPSRMIRELLSDYLRERNVFSRVLHETESIEPDWVLESHVYALEECDRSDARYARLSMLLRVVNRSDNHVLAEHRFDRMNRLNRQDSRLLPGILSLVLKSELDQLVEKLKPQNPISS